MKFKNQRSDNFLASVPQASLDLPTDRISEKCKFNFAYFEKQEYGKSFEELSQEELSKLLNKLRDYSRETLGHWRNESIGTYGKVLVDYGAFPTRTEFKHPKSVPHQVRWGRFRLDQNVRLAGFVIPDSYNGTKQVSTGMAFDSNTFYVVFYDPEHKFYIPKD